MYKVANCRLNKFRAGEGEMLDCLGEIIRMMGMKNHDFGTGITLEADPT